MEARIAEGRDGPVATIELAEPERRNPLSLAVIDELSAALDRVAAEPSIRAVIIGARGPAFCAGHDLREMRDRDAAFYERLFAACAELMLRVHALPQPVIARVQGIATAAGCQLVAACDLAICAREARFATPGVKIGLFCTTPMVEVARVVGRTRAMQLLLTGEPIDAETALAWGLVNAVVDAADLDRAAQDLAGRVAAASGATLAIGKRAVHDNLALAGEAAYAHASAVMCRNALSEDAREGIAAFLEKRSPAWPGNAVVD